MMLLPFLSASDAASTDTAVEVVKVETPAAAAETTDVPAVNLTAVEVPAGGDAPAASEVVASETTAPAVSADGEVPALEAVVNADATPAAEEAVVPVKIDEPAALEVLAAGADPRAEAQDKADALVKAINEYGAATGVGADITRSSGIIATDQGAVLNALNVLLDLADPRTLQAAKLSILQQEEPQRRESILADGNVKDLVTGHVALGKIGGALKEKIENDNAFIERLKSVSTGNSVSANDAIESVARSNSELGSYLGVLPLQEAQIATKLIEAAANAGGGVYTPVADVLNLFNA